MRDTLRSGSANVSSACLVTNPLENALMAARVDAMRQVPMRRGNVAKQSVLQSTRVLNFVDQDVSIRILKCAQGTRLSLEQAKRQEQHRGIVDCAVGVKQRLVCCCQFGQEGIVESAGVTPRVRPVAFAKPKALKSTNDPGG
jgi:hypothetical protein